MSRLEEIIKRVIEKTDFSKHIMGSEPLQDDEFTDMEDVILGFRNSRLSLSFIIQFNNRVRVEYATECSKASLAKASKRAFLNFHDGTTKTNKSTQYYQIGADNLQVDKESITDQENIVIL